MFLYNAGTKKTLGYRKPTAINKELIYTKRTERRPVHDETLCSNY